MTLNMSEENFLLIRENSHTKFDQTKTRLQETSDIQLSKPKNTSFIFLKELKKEKSVMAVTYLDVFISIVSMTYTNNFSSFFFFWLL